MSILDMNASHATHREKTDAEIEQELQEFKWREETDERMSGYLQQVASNRFSANHWLKEQHTKNLLERLPQFERDTHAALDEMYQEVRHLTFKVLIMSWMIAGAVIVTVLTALWGGV